MPYFLSLILFLNIHNTPSFLYSLMCITNSCQNMQIFIVHSSYLTNPQQLVSIYTRYYLSSISIRPMPDNLSQNMQTLIPCAKIFQFLLCIIMHTVTPSDNAQTHNIYQSMYAHHLLLSLSSQQAYQSP